jgi:DNA-binding NarL/FixJ family response regulator
MYPIYIVIVDSDPRFLEIATQFLQKREGVLVYSAVSTSNEILRQAKVFEPDVVLYNLDQSDPKSIETIKKLRVSFPAMNIIVVAPPENEKFKQSVMEAGASDFVLRYAMNLEFLPAIWSLISMYQHRYGKSGISTIPGRKPPTHAMQNTLKASGLQRMVH